MNKLDRDLYKDIVDEYVEAVVPLIKEKYDIFKQNNLTTYLNDTFDLDTIFNNDNVMVDLLSGHFNVMDDIIIDYIKTCLFVSWTKDKGYLVKDMRKYFSCNKQKKVVEMYFNCFKNPIIESYMDSNVAYTTLSSLKKLSSIIRSDLAKLNMKIKEIIDYQDIYTLNLRDKIMISAKIDICPYCGRQFITRFNDRSSADLDHFYPKKYLPLLSLSLYNFVPSCQICNSRFKNQQLKKILYPFHDGYDKHVKFNVKYISPITQIKPNVKIKLDNISKDKYFEVDEDIKLFHIDEVYQSHNEFVADLLFKKHIYNNQRFREGIQNIVPSNLNNEEINILLYGYSLDANKDKSKILGKLANDVLK